MMHMSAASEKTNVSGTAGRVAGALHPSAMFQPQRFAISVTQDQLDDLRGRLERARLDDTLPAEVDRRGLPVATLRALVDAWRAFDWRRQERRLAELPHHTVTLDGQPFHFVHVRSAEPDALPLVLGHGWPSTFVEFVELIGPLVDPRAHGGRAGDAFHVVIPSLPGFAYSSPLTSAGWNVQRTARAWARLMAGLGYSRYGAHGGDWGALVARELGRIDAEHVVGVHLTMLPSAVASKPPQEGAREPERMRRSFERRQALQQDGVGYGMIQSTRPATIGQVLADSPVAQLAWIAEKLLAWTDPRHPLDRDHLLTTVTLYWLTRTAGSSANVYYEGLHDGTPWGAPPPPSTTPTALSSFEHDLALPVRELAEKTDRIEAWYEHDHGGHFPAFEVPELLLGDLRRFFRSQ
jgi:hypothetical protein